MAKIVEKKIRLESFATDEEKKRAEWRIPNQGQKEALRGHFPRGMRLFFQVEEGAEDGECGDFLITGFKKGMELPEDAGDFLCHHKPAGDMIYFYVKQVPGIEGEAPSDFAAPIDKALEEAAESDPDIEVKE